MTNPSKEIEQEILTEETPDTSDPIEVNNQRKKYARTRATRLHFVEAAMTTQEGRAWFYDVLLFCKVFANPYQDDPYKTAFTCGERNVGLNILSDIQEAASENYVKMISENKTRKNG